MKHIETVIEDVYELLKQKQIMTEDGVFKMSASIQDVLVSRFLQDGQYKPSLRMSNFGKPDKQLWYLINHPEWQEPLRPEVRFKFLYGDLIEAMILPLIEEAGHTVEGKQDKQEVNGLIGHRDAVIDGMLIDIKSANSRTFQKFKDGSFIQHDPFGYLDQLHLYLMAAKDDPKVKFKNKAGWIIIDKELGHIILRTMEFPNKDYAPLIDAKRAMLKSSMPPVRCFADKPEGASGNRRLDTQCSYCDFKKHCWPGVRTFLYAGGPVHLTKVVKEPNVVELK